MNTYDKLKKIATYLHSFCPHNHADYCAWRYEMIDGEDNWNEWTHQQYLKRAQEILNLLNEVN